MKRKSKTKHCCDDLKGEVENKYRHIHKQAIFYDAARRCYGIIINMIDEEETERDGKDLGLYDSYITMAYCPFCGTKFPSDLGEKWSDVIGQELGPEYLIESRAKFQKFLCRRRGEEYVPDPDFPQAKPLPKEFKTDEWWKKRGL